MAEETIEEVYRQAICARIDARGLSRREVAAIVGCTRRTVIRVVCGHTRRMATLRHFMAQLGVKVAPKAGDKGCHPETQSHAMTRNHTQSDAETRITDRDGPVVGWRQAAIVLDVSHDTLQRDRLRYGSQRVRPWWSSRQACREWYDALVSGPRLREEPTEVLVAEARRGGMGE